MAELKRIDFNAKAFTGKSGKEYRIELDQLSVGRYEMYERMAANLGFGADFKSIFGSFHQIYTAATSGDSTLAALHRITEICQGQMAKVKEVSEGARKDEFIFCTLFCNTEGEDRSVWDIEEARRKVDDWDEYDARDFFLLSRYGIEGYVDALRRIDEEPETITTKKSSSSPSTSSTSKNNTTPPGGPEKPRDSQ